MPAWTKKQHKEFERSVILALNENITKLRRSGALPEGFEESEPASIPKIALALLGENLALSDNAKRELKNARHFV